jgi:hypothetical protein
MHKKYYEINFKIFYLEHEPEPFNKIIKNRNDKNLKVSVPALTLVIGIKRKQLK